MKNIRYRNLTPKVRRIAVIVAAIALFLSPLSAIAEKTNVFFIHGANVSEQDARAWAAVMFKGLYQAGANMEFYSSSLFPSHSHLIRIFRTRFSFSKRTNYNRVNLVNHV